MKEIEHAGGMAVYDALSQEWYVWSDIDDYKAGRPKELVYLGTGMTDDDIKTLIERLQSGEFDS